MKYLFVSPERVVQDKYRHGLVFRLAGALTLLGAVLQIPIFGLGILTWTHYRDQLSQQNLLRAEENDLQKANAPLNDVRQKLSQIHQWEPIIRDRVPVSALLNAIQASTPPNAVLDSVAIEAEQFDHLPVSGGFYRVPRNYRVVLQGLEKLQEGEAVQEFSDALQKCLPTGSELVRSERMQKRADGFVPFMLLYSVKPSGNYFGLGLKRIAEPDTL